MRTKLTLIKPAALLLALSTLDPQLSALFAQDTAFTYQGRLNDGVNPANGNYDVTFTLYGAGSGGSVVAGPLTNSATAVSNGLFTVRLDLGVSAFDGSNRWLEISVRTNGAGAFTLLTPLQPLTPTPYALFAANAGAAILASTAATANSVVAANLIGTVSLSNLPETLITNNQSGITLNGTLSGNGAGLTNLTALSGFSWQVVSGTTQLAQPNTGYLLTNNALGTVTLPASPTLGDVTRVSGIGSNGWKIAQNPGQSVFAANLQGSIGASWTPRESNRQWTSVASSADGSKLVAVVYGGQIYTSTNSGATWTPRDSNRTWYCAASSSDGAKLVAGVGGFGSVGQIYTSTDSGVTWTPNGVSTNWYSIASSADGTKLVAVVDGPKGGQIYTSVNSGANWTARAGAPSTNWTCVASSADGTKLVAVVAQGQIYTSVNSGVAWTARDSSRDWGSVASSADGTRLAAAVGAGGQIYTSPDSGVTWTVQTSGTRTWSSVASSSDGTKLIAGVGGSGQIYTSTDSGATWTARESNRDWRSVASSADGSKLVAVVGGGQIYTVSNFSNPGTTGYLLGNQNAAIELQYIGNGQFLPISSAGTVRAY